MGNFTKSYHANVGLNHTPAYQVSGRPYASGAIDAQDATSLEFPFVTRWVQVTNHSSADVRVGFSENGVSGSNYFRVHASCSSGIHGQSNRLELKVSQLWLYSPGKPTSIDVVAGLTTIPVSRVSASAGLSFSGSVGVG